MPEEQENAVIQKTESTIQPEGGVGEEQKPETATEMLKRGVAEIEKKATSATGAATEFSEEGSGDDQQSVVDTGKKPEEETETETSEESEKSEELEEGEFLKRAGFTQNSLEDVKTDLNKAMGQAELFNWLNNNVPGFSDFAYQQMLRARGLESSGKSADLKDVGKKPQSEPQKTGEASLLEKYDPTQIEEFKEIAEGLGFVHRDEIESQRQAEKAEASQEKARDVLKSFGKSKQTKEYLKALNMDWDKDVKGMIVKTLIHDFGIPDPGHITPENVTRAFNIFLMEKPGGIEKLLSNVKTEALNTHKDKLKLGQPIPKTGTRPSGKGKRSIQDLINDPNTTSKDIQDAMRGLVSKRR